MKNYDERAAELAGTTREFSLRGQTFTAKPTMPGDAFDDLADIQGGKPTTNRIFGLFADIIRRTLVPESREAWDELIAADLDVPIETLTLAEIADDLVSAETGRPPQQPSPSTSSPANAGTPSTGNSGSAEAKDSKISRSAPV